MILPSQLIAHLFSELMSTFFLSRLSVWPSHLLIMIYLNQLHIFIQAFHTLFQWDIDNFQSDVDLAYNCWTQWAQQYLTLLTNHDFHSRGAIPCIKTGKPATPITRELPSSYRPYATLFNQVVSTIALFQHTPDIVTDVSFSHRVSTIAASARSLFDTFTPFGSTNSMVASFT